MIENDVVGSIGIHPLADIYAKNAEMGYWIGEAFWGKGIVTSAVKEMLAYGFKTFDVERIFSRTSHINTSSQRVLSKCGFRFEAELKDTIYKNGDFYYECIYSIWRKYLI